MARFNNHRARIGDKVRVTLTTGETYDMIVSQVNDPVSMGLAEYRGPQVIAHIRPGGYSVSLSSSIVASVETVEND